MFSLLTPAVLWLAPLLAVPLAIALMGRAQPKTRDFPSLLPVRESLQRAMRRHRLKNWLQLILRTLAILCLLLAAAGPVWRTGSSLQPPGGAGLLVNNGAYASLPHPSEGTQLARQQALLSGLDSLTGGNVVAEPLLPEAWAGSEGRAAARLGSSTEAVARLLRAAGERFGPRTDAHLYVPVFDARDLSGLARAARPWLEQHPGARLIAVDQGDAAARLRAFGNVGAVFEKEGMVSLQAATAAAEQPPQWTSGNTPTSSARAARLRDGIADVPVPLPPSPDPGSASWIAGSFALTEADSARAGVAFASVAAAFRIPPPATLCHVGPREAVASLATLGAGGQRLRVRAVLPGAGTGSGATGDCDLLYLADPPNADAALLARAASVLRSGGKVILETGKHTDPVLWNRNLLAPLGLGRLTAIIPSVAGEAARAQARSISALGMRGERWGGAGTVRTRFGFLPAAGTAVLLSAGEDLKNPLLLHRRLGDGELLLWTTSLSDPAWSDIGAGPWAALAHQAFLAKAWAAGIEPRSVETDSHIVLPSPEDDALRVLDPAGNPFTRLRAEPGGWIAGPFDRPGLYRVESRGGRSWFAATLAEPPRAAESADWEGFRAALGETAWEQTVVLKAGKDWRGLYGGLPLRSVLLGIAALLLFAEGVVSLRLTHLVHLSEP